MKARWNREMQVQFKKSSTVLRLASLALYTAELRMRKPLPAKLYRGLPVKKFFEWGLVFVNKICKKLQELLHMYTAGHW